MTDKDRKIISDDDEFMVVRPLTWKGVLYYGRNTYIGLDEEGYDRLHTSEILELLQNGEIFIVFNKKTNTKNVIYRPYNQKSYEISIDDEEYGSISKAKKDYDNFNELSKKTQKIVFGSKFFDALRRYIKGVISSRTFENSDNMIYSIGEDFENRLNSKIHLENNEGDDGFLDIIDLSDDEIWFYNTIKSRHFEFIDYSRYEYGDDSFLAVIYDRIDEEGRNMIKKISKFFFPEKEIDDYSEKDFVKLEDRITDSFGRYYNDIEYYYISKINELANEIAEDDVDKQLNVFFKENGFDYESSTEIVTTPRKLLEIYSTVGDVNSSLSDVLAKYFKLNLSNSHIGWSDYYEYEYQADARIDSNEFNEKVKNELGNIIDKLEDDPDYREYINLIDRIKKKYKFGNMYQAPYGLYFKIMDINPGTKKLTVHLQKIDTEKNTKQNKVHQFSEEDFYKFINNPEIFSIFDEN
jgi:hypothetical protein